MSRPVGCLLWLVMLLVILIAAAMLFGGFQTGTKAAAQGAVTGQSLSDMKVLCGLGW